MSFPKYAEYKDSGDAWVGEIPANWRSMALGRVLSQPVTDGPHTTPVFVDSGVPFLSVDGIQNGSLTFEGCRHVSKADHEEFSKKAAPKRDDLLMGKAASIGKIARVQCDFGFSIWSPLALIRVDQSACLPVHAEYLLKSPWLQAQIETAANSNTQLNIGMKDIPKLRICLPPVPEQVAISNFLGRETGKIDALIAEQEKLLALLAEKRQATISHAVTRGLTANVPIKDSGIPWLGEVPAHWTVEPVSARYRVQLGKMLDTNKITGSHLRPYLRVFDVQWGMINTNDLPLMDFDEAARERYRLVPGDLLVNEGGSYPGRSAIWLGEVRDCYYQKALHRMRPIRGERDSTRFFYYVMNWAANGGLFVAGGNETTIEHLPAEKLRRYRFGFPPVQEQLEISVFLDREMGRFGRLQTQAERAISLLKDRRSALIAAAVTGKIDVRCMAEQAA